MRQLTATFRVQLSTPVLLRGTGQARVIETVVGDFMVQVTLQPDEGARSKGKNQRLWTYRCSTFVVAVSRAESDSPPQVVRALDGTRDLTRVAAYFGAKLPSYRSVAALVTNNAISFFKYSLHQLLLRPVAEGSQDFKNPDWTDDSGQRIQRGRHTFVVPRVAGEWGEFGATKFERRHTKALQAALRTGRTPKLYEELLSDAQAAAADGNVRRSVLELAIACEVFVKHVFLGGDSQSAQVVEALEDKGRFHVRVVELLEVGSSVARGRSFRDFDKSAYTDIQHLFRARNKVAHRGEAVFRDDGRSMHAVDHKLLLKWWTSVQTLFEWAG